MCSVPSGRSGSRSRNLWAFTLDFAVSFAGAFLDGLTSKAAEQPVLDADVLAFNHRPTCVGLPGMRSVIASSKSSPVHVTGELFTSVRMDLFTGSRLLFVAIFKTGVHCHEQYPSLLRTRCEVGNDGDQLARTIRRHLRVVAQLNRVQFVDREPSHQAVILAVFLALVGVVMALYLTLAG